MRRTQCFNIVMFKALTIGLVLFSVFTGCSKKAGTAYVRGPSGNNPNQKVINEIPPEYTAEQISAGNYFVWKRLSSDGKISCKKWEFIEVKSGFAKLKQNESDDCIKFSAKHDLFYIETDHFEVTDQYLFNGFEYVKTPESSSNFLIGKKLNAYFLHSDSKLKHTVGSGIIEMKGKDKYPLFSLVDWSRTYYLGNQTENTHPWHAFLMNYQTSDSPNFRYYYFDSKPKLTKVP